MDLTGSLTGLDSRKTRIDEKQLGVHFRFIQDFKTIKIGVVVYCFLEVLR